MRIKLLVLSLLFFYSLPSASASSESQWCYDMKAQGSADYVSKLCHSPHKDGLSLTFYRDAFGIGPYSNEPITLVATVAKVDTNACHNEAATKVSYTLVLSVPDNVATAPDGFDLDGVDTLELTLDLTSGSTAAPGSPILLATHANLSLPIDPEAPSVWDLTAVEKLPIVVPIVEKPPFVVPVMAAPARGQVIATVQRYLNQCRESGLHQVHRVYTRRKGLRREFFSADLIGEENVVAAVLNEISRHLKPGLATLNRGAHHKRLGTHIELWALPVERVSRPAPHPWH